jgi:peptidylprolyl isomerase
MRTILAITVLALAIPACQRDKNKTEGEKGEPAKTTDQAAANTANPHAGMAAPADIPAPPDVAAPPADAKKTEKGVFYKVLEPGKADGKKPGTNDTVEVNYTGWTTDGKMFDSSVKRGRPAKFGLSQVIPGWTDGLQVMTVGEKTRFWIPEELAYKGQQGAPQGMLVFDVELIAIE